MRIIDYYGEYPLPRKVPIPTMEGRYAVVRLDLTEDPARLIYEVLLTPQNKSPVPWECKVATSWLPINADLEDEQSIMAAFEEAYYEYLKGGVSETQKA